MINANILSDRQFLFVGGGLLLFLWWKKRQLDRMAGQLNPLNPDNAINAVAESAWTAVTGNPSAPGVAVYDWMNGDRDTWTLGRTDQIIWERKEQGLPLDPMGAIAQARWEWNQHHAGWLDRWSTKDLMGYQP